MPRAFRFGVFASNAQTVDEWRTISRRAEALGYDVFLMGDHMGPQFAPVPGLVAAAAATERIRIGTFVLANDYRTPVMLAKELTTLDVLSRGRLEIGLGAGWARTDYDALGIGYDPPAVRVERLMEAVTLLKRLLTGERVVHSGAHYRVDAAVLPRPLQRPRPPLLVGGGGRRILEFAAREADIVALLPQADATGHPQPGSLATALLDARVQQVREAAADGFGKLELNIIAFDASVGHSRPTRARHVPARFEREIDAVHDSPYFLYGTADQLIRRLREQRARTGISYIALPATAMEEFSPIVAELAGT